MHGFAAISGCHWQTSHVGPQQRDSAEQYVAANARAKRQFPMYMQEQWHALAHDVELELHREIPVPKVGANFPEVQVAKVRRQRRLECPPKLSAELDQIANWLQDFLRKKGREELKEVA